MTEQWMKWVQRFRLAIYASLFLTLAVIEVSHLVYASPTMEVSDDEGEKNEFWPPDMVPHPHPPGSGPSGPGEPELA